MLRPLQGAVLTAAVPTPVNNTMDERNNNDEPDQTQKPHDVLVRTKIIGSDNSMILSDLR
jgi:hypothetical protein